jgi:hypothetical protein
MSRLPSCTQAAILGVLSALFFLSPTCRDVGVDHSLQGRTQPVRVCSNATSFAAPTLVQADDALAAGHANAAIVAAAIRAGCAKHFNESEMMRRPPLNASVSVIIGAWNRPLTLRVIVAALRQQRLIAGKVEIIVMDGGSSPPISQLLPGLDVDQLHYWKEDGLYHRVRSFNAGVAFSSHDVVILLDDDVIPASDFWAYTAVAALTSEPDKSVMRMPLAILEMKADLGDAQGRRAELEGQGWETLYGFTTTNIALRRQAWDKLGGLNALHDGVYGDEDTDFHSRAAAQGLAYGVTGKSGCGAHVGLFFGNRGTGKPRRGH